MSRCHEPRLRRPVCASCGKVFNEYLDDEADWHEGTFNVLDREVPYRDDELDHLCPECHAVVVEGETETREWMPTASG